MNNKVKPFLKWAGGKSQLLPEIIKNLPLALKEGKIDTYAEPFTRVKLNVSQISNDYRAGEKVTIVDNYNDQNRELVINKIVKKFPHKWDELHCGDKEYAISEYNKLTMDRIKRLEEEFSKNDDLLIQVIDLSRTFKPRRRYNKIQKRIIVDTDKLIWDHPTQGQWNDEAGAGSNTEEWGDLGP